MRPREFSARFRLLHNAGTEFARSPQADAQATDPKANLAYSYEMMRGAERIARIAWRDGANNSGNERNFTFGAAKFDAVDPVQQSGLNLHVPSAKNDTSVVRLPHMAPAR
jgi:hypothetical protein